MTGEVPGAAAQVFARAEALRDLGRPAEALGLVRQGLASDPHDVTLLVLATTLSLALEDYAQAADFATQAAAQAPGWALPLALLAQARRLADDPAGGKQAAQAALHLDPDEALAHFEVGLATALEAEQAPLWHRRRLLTEARAAASRVEALWPDQADGPALQALIDIVGGRWPQHEANIARALEREPDDSFAHNVRLLGLQARHSGETVPQLYERLRSRPDDVFARSQLRTHFSFAGWMRQYWGRWWWIFPLLVVTRLIGLFLLSLPLYFLWHLRRVRQYPEIYAAVFSPAERRRTRQAHLVLAGPLLAFGVLLAANAVVPALFVNKAAVYGPVALLSGAAVLALTVPAALTGRGGFFGRSPDDLRRAPLPPARRWTLRSLAWPLFLAVPSLLLLMGDAGLLWVFISDPKERSGGLDSAALMLLLTVMVIMVLALSVHRARYGNDVPPRFSLTDGLVAALVATMMLAFSPEVFRALGLS